VDVSQLCLYLMRVKSSTAPIVHESQRFRAYSLPNMCGHLWCMCFFGMMMRFLNCGSLFRHTSQHVASIVRGALVSDVSAV
jgi:hypothetical protein